MKVAKLVTKPTLAEEFCEESVQILENALNLVREGKIESVLVILRQPDGKWRYEHSGVRGFPEAIGQLEIVKQAWINKYESSSLDKD